ncbi:glycosyltransferase family 2 protein, partial [Roseimaritima sediminicola]|uniref:glycosyltransferase family 2 protein n=1 Tax=Roseimaritima sediminicola TaxID=2662066 RepID=UPI001298404D
MLRVSAPNRNDGRLAIIVPVFNERSSVAACLRHAQAFANACGDVGEIVIVDDASTDGTVEIVEQTIAGWELNAILGRHPENRGKGAAIRTGLDHVTSPLVVVQDADLEYDPSDLKLLLQRMRDCRGIAVYGSRRLAGRPSGERPFSLFVWGRLSFEYNGAHAVQHTHHRRSDLLQDVSHRGPPGDAADLPAVSIAKPRVPNKQKPRRGGTECTVAVSPLRGLRFFGGGWQPGTHVPGRGCVALRASGGGNPISRRREPRVSSRSIRPQPSGFQH